VGLKRPGRREWKQPKGAPPTSVAAAADGPAVRCASALQGPAPRRDSSHVECGVLHRATGAFQARSEARTRLCSQMTLLVRLEWQSRFRRPLVDRLESSLRASMFPQVGGGKRCSSHNLAGVGNDEGQRQISIAQGSGDVGPGFAVPAEQAALQNLNFFSPFMQWPVQCSGAVLRFREMRTEPEIPLRVGLFRCVR
jgi:hypothetical protein